MKVIGSISQMQKTCKGLKAKGRTIAFVPTMGYLHDGHLELMSCGRKKADVLVVSIFVNPTQFGPNEDLAKYPRDLEGDLKKCKDKGVDIVFTPTEKDMYEPDHQTYVEVEKVTKDLCGASRPRHFRGVTTIVAKLFNIVQPDVAIFGQKDFQQLITINQMVKDLNFSTKIIGLPTVREKDGLAMSSRNNYLDQEKRKLAANICKTLQAIRDKAKKGEGSTKNLIGKGLEVLNSNSGIDLEYLKICDCETLEPTEKLKSEAIVAIAAKIGSTRLIDNIKISLKGGTHEKNNVEIKNPPCNRNPG